MLTWAGSGLVLVSAVIHFHLWDSDGYNKIPTIGALFLMQAVVGAVWAIAASVLRHWLVVIGEAGFALSSAGGLIISVNVGLFGWQETMSAPFAWLALSVEFAATAALGLAGGLLWLGPVPARRRSQLRA
jgi:hypothetical protein